MDKNELDNAAVLCERLSDAALHNPQLACLYQNQAIIMAGLVTVLEKLKDLETLVKLRT
jgi:hypothetical protein